MFVGGFLGYARSMRISDELFAPVSPGIELCYQTFGDPDDEPLLLVMGLGGPMTWWNPDLCTLLASKGFFVIRYDNRDSGRSSRAKGRVTRSMLVRGFTGRRVRPPYTMADLADDGFRLLDHLGIDSAHICGVSMGGMIVQTMACTHPQRVRSLTSIMSTLGKRTRRLAGPQAAADAARPPERGPRGVRRDVHPDVEADRLPGLPGGPRVGARAGRRDLRPWRQHERRAAPDAGDRHPAQPRPPAPRAAAPGAGDPWRLRPDGARVRRPGDRPGDPGRRADPGQGHGPRHAGGALRDDRRRHPPDSGPGPIPSSDKGMRTRPGRSSGEGLPASR